MPSIVFSAMQPSNSELPSWVVISNNLLFVSIHLSLLASVGVCRLHRALAVERLLRPQQDGGPDAVRRALGQALGDRDVQLALWSPSRGAFLTQTGLWRPSPPIV